MKNEPSREQYIAATEPSREAVRAALRAPQKSARCRVSIRTAAWPFEARCDLRAGHTGEHEAIGAERVA